MTDLPADLAKTLEAAIAGSFAAAGRTTPPPEFWDGFNLALVRFPLLGRYPVLAYLAGASVALGVEIERARAKRIGEAAGEFNAEALAMIVGGDDEAASVAWLGEANADLQKQRETAKIVEFPKDRNPPPA